jgi:hypothetical protein
MYQTNPALDEHHQEDIIRVLSCRDITNDIRLAFETYREESQVLDNSELRKHLLLQALRTHVNQGRDDMKNSILLAWTIEELIATKDNHPITIEHLYQVFIDSSYPTQTNRIFALIMIRFLNYIFANNWWIPTYHAQLTAKIKDTVLAQDSLALSSDIILHHGATKDPTFQDKSIDQGVFQMGMKLLLRKDADLYHRVRKVSKEQFNQDFIAFLRERAKIEIHHMK